ncbi:zinc-binding alcohol dehydrogenase [Xanthobacter sp. DSM 24535]|uniref:zinc-dependent alcohol dehydrogenase n=1 Tax=Roseixanthobacter psychrophilus TaxID=3119917 RepID=UPI00372BD18B
MTEQRAAVHHGAPDHAQAEALWYVAPRCARLKSEPLRARERDELLVATSWSAVSRGTERLIFDGLIDPVHRDRMRAPMQSGDFPFPVKYGYCAVGRVEAGPPHMLGRDVFALHPHQDRFVIGADKVMLVPRAVPARRATLAANMETALNALWDSGAGAGDRIVVVGAGLVGLLIVYLAARLPGADVTALDPCTHRRAIAESFGARFTTSPDPIAEADVVFHASATSEGLSAAIGCGGASATLVEVSWYGDKSVTVELGGPFHAKRLRLISSQVGAVPPERQPRWSLKRRLAKALDLLDDPRLDALITDEVAFSDLPDALDSILGAGTDAVATVVRYSA